MTDFYRVPAVAVLSMLLIVYALLYLQSRTTRRLLWLLGWTLVVVHLAFEIRGYHAPGWGAAISNISLVLASQMFLGSLSPMVFRPFKILYVYAFAAPLAVFATLVSFFPHPMFAVHAVLMICTIAMVYVAISWSTHKNLLPAWFSVSFTMAVGLFAVWLTYKGEYFFTLYLAQSASNFIAGLLFVVAFRRFTPGVIFTSAGMFLWSMPSVLDAVLSDSNNWMVVVARSINLIKVMTAVGMVLLVLEDEVLQNRLAKERDHRARLELEEYSAIDLSLLAQVNAESVYQHVCEVIARASLFAEVLLFLQGVENHFELTGRAGMEDARVDKLVEAGKRWTPEHGEFFRKGCEAARLEELGVAHPLPEMQQIVGKEVYVIPIWTREDTCCGLLLLSGMKKSDAELQADDVLPLELLMLRLAAKRESNALMQRVARSEKMAGLGELAAGVAHELNNPLTVVLGYSELIEEELEGNSLQNQVSIIRSEARRMQQIVENTLRFWRSSPVDPFPVDISSVFEEVEEHLAPEFESRGIQLQIHLAEGLPDIYGNRNQLQKTVIQVLKRAVDSFVKAANPAPIVRVEASRQGGYIKILISDNGTGFMNPEKAFDPFYATSHPRSGAGMALSACYAIIRDHGGDITAHNLHPAGSAVVIDLPVSSQCSAGVLKSKTVTG